MTTSQRTFAFGTLGASTDTWFLVTQDKTILLDVPFAFDGSLEHKTVSVIGTMGIPTGSPFNKLIVGKIVSHEAIARRAREISKGATHSQRQLAARRA